jgi:hypothetical protein
VSGLGRKAPKDWNHVDKYPLSAAAAVALSPTPAVMAVNWYPTFDEPYKRSDGAWYVKMPPTGERPRGGHCVALKPRYVVDTTGWYDFYDQGSEGACVGFGCSRVMSLMNRKRYAARWLWDRAKEIDEWSDTNPGDDEGTSARAALDVLRTRGHVRDAVSNRELEAPARASLKPVLSEGIQANRWIRSIDDLLEVLGYQNIPYVDLINSWGRSYPHLVRMPLDVVERLWYEDGELGVVVDR